MLSNHLILGCPLVLLPSISHTNKVFSNESVLCIRLPRYWSFSFRISSSNDFLFVVQSLVMSDSLLLYGLKQASLSFTISWTVLKFMSIESVMLSSHLILCTHFSSYLQSFPTSGSFPVSQFFTSGHQVTSPSNEYSGLISFRIDWFDPLAVQGTLKGLFQHHNSKASIL